LTNAIRNRLIVEHEGLPVQKVLRCGEFCRYSVSAASKDTTGTTAGSTGETV